MGEKEMNIIICRGGNQTGETIKSKIKSLSGMNNSLAVMAAKSNLSVDIVKELYPFLNGSTMSPIFVADRMLNNIPFEDIARSKVDCEFLSSILFNEFHKVAMEVATLGGKETINHLMPLKSKLLPIAGNVIDILKTKKDW